MDEREAIISGRQLDFCPSTADRPVPELLEECPLCNEFFLYCCGCNTRRLRGRPHSSGPNKPCHHYPIIFTDGACENNGQAMAKSGAGVAYGKDDDSQSSVPITDMNDNFPLRSNQRAELFAAIMGLETISKHRYRSKVWIIATDSQYVVEGMTKWLPRWKQNNMRTSKRTKPANLDLFLVLDDEMAKYEAKGVQIGLWLIPRKYNKIADSLAKAAAADGDVASM